MDNKISVNSLNSKSTGGEKKMSELKYGQEEIINLKNMAEGGDHVEEIMSEFEERIETELCKRIEPSSDLFSRVLERALKIGCGEDKKHVVSSDVIEVIDKFSDNYENFLSAEIQFKGNCYAVYPRQGDRPPARTIIDVRNPDESNDPPE